MGLRAAPSRTEPAYGRAWTLPLHARARLLQPRLRGRHGIQRSHPRHYSNRGWRTWSVGEALLASQGKTVDAPGIVAAWLASPPHREIILSPTWRDAGIGALYAPTAPREYGGAETIVVTADFGMREGRPSSPFAAAVTAAARYAASVWIGVWPGSISVAKPRSQVTTT